jgi:fluoroquinolone transport system permease protein
VAVATGLAARFLLSSELAGPALALVILLGIGGTTYIFGASLVLADKSQGTLQALRTSPVTARQYIVSKVVTLVAFAMLESAIIYVVGFFGTPFDIAPLVAGVVVLGAFYALLSMGQVAPHDSVFSFLIPGALLVGSITQWPALYVLEIGPPEIWYFIPTMAPLLLMLAGYEPLATWQWVYAIVVSLGSIAVVAWWAERRFVRFTGLSEASR